MLLDKDQVSVASPAKLQKITKIIIKMWFIQLDCC